MKIRWHGMAGTQMSWSIVTQYLAREMFRDGHQVFIKSTNGLEHFPEDLKPLLLPGYHNNFSKGPKAEYLDNDGNIIFVDQKNPLPEINDKNIPYDLELAYTVFLQAPRRFMIQSRARALIWNFESSILPPGWDEYHRALDYILPSSQYSYDIFAKNGIPKDKMLVVPHGVDTSLFNPDIIPYKLKTTKKVKFLHNAIPHHRKFHERVIKGYLDAFDGNDDVCLVLKTKFLTPAKDKPFEVDMKSVLEKYFKGRKNPPEIEIINSYIPNIGSLYTASHAVVSMSSAEGFCIPLLEALACDSVVIAPRHGGQLDFLNDSNSLLVDTGEMKAPISQQYWAYNKDAVVGDPDTRHFSELLRRVYESPEKEKSRVRESARETVSKFTWKSASKMILDLPIPTKSKRISTKQKVLYIIPYNILGGGEIWIRDNIVKLDKNLFEPHVACLNITTELKQMFINAGAVRVENLTSTSQLLKLKCLLESEIYSIVHFYNSFGVYNVLKNTWNDGWRCCIVETVHSDLSWPDSMTKVATRDGMVSMLTTVSRQMATKLSKLGNKNVAYLPPAIDWKRFKLEKNKSIFDELNIPNKFTVGFVGRLSPEKNIPAILQCARLLPDISFVIVGNGPQETALKQFSKNLENVHYVGRRNDIEKFYAAFDVLILSSNMEGMPLVILEAMASGTPIVANNVGAVSEVVKDGFNGFVVKNGDYVSAIKKIQEDDMWKRCSAGGKITIENFEKQSNQFDINVLYKLLFNSVGKL